MSVPPTKKTISFTDLVSEVRLEVDKLYKTADLTAVLAAIDHLFSELNGHGVSGKLFENFTADELSIMGGQLAVLRSSLIEPKAEALRQTRIALRHKQVKEGGLRISVKEALSDPDKKPPSVADIDAELERQLARANLIHDFNEAWFEKLQSYWYSIPDVLKRIERRIHVLEGDRDTSHLYGDEAAIPVEDPSVGGYNWGPAMQSKMQDS